MDRITGFAAVPPTLSSVSSSDTGTAMATTTLTKTVTRTLSFAVSAEQSTAAAAAATTNRNFAPSAHISYVPSHLLNQVTHLYASTSKYRQFKGLVHISPVLKMLLGAAVAGGGIAVLYNKLPRMAQNPPVGENQRSWTRKVKYAYAFLKNVANGNEQLRKDIAKAHEERDRALQDMRMLESSYTGTDTDSNKLNREMDAIQKEVAIYKEEIHAFRIENTDLNNELAHRDDQAAQLLQANQDSVELGKQLSLLLAWAQVEPVELQNQVDQLVRDRNSGIDELQKAHDESRQLQELLNTARGQRDEARQELGLVQAENNKFVSQTQVLQRDLESARAENDELLTQTQMLQQESSSLQIRLQMVEASAHQAEELRSQCETYRAQAAGLQQALDAKDAELEEANELSQLSKQIEAEYQQGLVAEQQQRKKAESDLADAVRQRTAVEDELARLKAQLELAQSKESKLQEVYEDDLNQDLKGLKEVHQMGLDAEKQERVKAQNDLANEVRKRITVEEELARTKESLAAARSGLISGRKSRPLVGLTATPSQPAVTSKRPGSAHSMPSATVRKSGLDASSPPIRSSATRDRVTETPTRQIKHEASITPTSSSSTASPEGTPSRKRSRDTEDDDNSVHKKIKSEPNSDAELMDTDDQPPHKTTSVFENAPIFRRPDQPSSSPTSRSPTPQYSPPPRPSAPTPRRASRVPAVAAESSSPVRRSARNAGKLPSLNERELSQRSVTPSVHAPRKSPARRQHQASPSKTARQTRSQSPRKG